MQAFPLNAARFRVRVVRSPPASEDVTVIAIIFLPHDRDGKIYFNRAKFTTTAEG